MPDITSPTTANGGGLAAKPGLKEGTVRFMLSAERARDEREWVDEYFRVMEEEYVVEVPVERQREKERDRRR